MYLASQNDNMPQALFIWSMQSLELASVVVQVATLLRPYHHKACSDQALVSFQRQPLCLLPL